MGWDESLFVDRAQLSELVCAICMDVCRDCSETPCGHLFCELCIAEAMKMNRVKNVPTSCPLDNSPVLEADVKPVMSLRRKILNLQIRCPTTASEAKNPCPWVGALRDQDQHVNTACAQRKVDCPYTAHGCKERLIAAEMAVHVEQSAKEHLALLEQRYKQLDQRCQTLTAENVAMTKEVAAKVAALGRAETKLALLADQGGNRWAEVKANGPPSPQISPRLVTAVTDSPQQSRRRLSSPQGQAQAQAQAQAQLQAATQAMQLSQLSSSLSSSVSAVPVPRLSTPPSSRRHASSMAAAGGAGGAAAAPSSAPTVAPMHDEDEKGLPLQFSQSGAGVALMPFQSHAVWAADGKDADADADADVDLNEVNDVNDDSNGLFDEAASVAAAPRNDLAPAASGGRAVSSLSSSMVVLSEHKERQGRAGASASASGSASAGGAGGLQRANTASGPLSASPGAPGEGGGSGSGASGGGGGGGGSRMRREWDTHDLVEVLTKYGSEKGGPEWQPYSEERDDHGRVVLTMFEPRSGFRVPFDAKAVGELNASPDVLLPFLLDTESKTDWMNYLEFSKIMEVIDPQTTILHERFKLIWPVKPREFVVVSHWKVLDNGIVILAIKSVMHHQVPLTLGSVRAERSGGFIIRPHPQDPNKSVVVCLGKSDLKGAIPAVIAKAFSKQAPAVVERLRELIPTLSLKRRIDLDAYKSKP